MFSYRKKPFETIEQKISAYEKVVNFYEKNRNKRFQNKSNLIGMLEETDLESHKAQTKKNLYKPCSSE